MPFYIEVPADKFGNRAYIGNGCIIIEAALESEQRLAVVSPEDYPFTHVRRDVWVEVEGPARTISIEERDKFMLEWRMETAVKKAYWEAGDGYRYASIYMNCYANSFAYLHELTEEAKRDYPNLKDGEILVWQIPNWSSSPSTPLQIVFRVNERHNAYRAWLQNPVG